jgi:PST family polysaccharide transporter
VNILLGIVRTKVLALLLGPGGVGLIGIYSSILDIARNIAGMGINSSGVRQIAEAVGTGDKNRISITISTLRRTTLILGAIGGIGLVALSRPISLFTFGSSSQAGSIALLGLAVLFGAVSAGQAALVQGMRRIGDLARMSILGAVYGTITSVVVIYLLGERGVAPFLVVVAGAGILTSWWYARKIAVIPVKLSLRRTLYESKDLLNLGLVFMATGFMTVGVAYLVRVMVSRNLGMESAGHYQAAWALAGLYVGFILQAMGADFYPRLTAVANDHAECNQLVNEQTEICLLLAGPGILATLTFAPVVIHLFYSAKFGPAIELLRWTCLGMLLRVGSWPMGYILLAKGAKGRFFISELSANAVHLFLVWMLITSLRLKGVGVAFVGLYIFYGAFVYLLAWQLTGFRWSSRNARLACVLMPAIAGVFIGTFFLPQGWIIAIGALATFGSAWYSLKTLCCMVSLQRLSGPVRKLFGLLRITPADL